MSRRAKSPKGKADAKRARAGKSLREERARVHDLEKRLKESLEGDKAKGELLEEKNRALTEAHAQIHEALEQQTATSEILRVVRSSPTDVQPTFDAIAASARRLCEAAHSMVFRFDGELIHLAAHDNLGPDHLDAIRSVFPLPPGRGSVTARAILTRALVHVRDRREDPELEYSALSANFPNTLSLPLLREGVPLGAITVTRSKAGLFSDRQIALLQTFADQAVIAIENVRLFTELQQKNEALTQAHAQVTEALGQQTATSEILRVISSSPTDVQPVFDAIAESARRLCDADFCNVARYEDGLIHLSAHAHSAPELVDAMRRMFPMPPTRATTFGRTITEGGLVYIRDIREDPEYSPTLAEAHRSRCGVGVPMLRDSQPIGAIVVGGREPQKFSDTQIALLKTFADQAVIAIENVRLFTELGARNRDLSEALEQQTATAEILRVISQSQTDVQPVFDTIVKSAVRLCDGLISALYQFDGELIHRVAQHNYTREAIEASDRVFPARPTRPSG